MICPKCQFDQPDSKNCVRCGVIFAKYQAYLDRLEQDIIAAQSNENNIEIEEKNPAEKIRVLFSFLTLRFIMALLIPCTRMARKRRRGN